MTTLHILHPYVPRGPLTRGECREWVYPCRLRACRHNLGHDEGTMHDGGAAHRRLRPAPVDGCALDVAASGPSSIEAVASAVGLSRTRVQQIEWRAAGKLARLSAAKVLQRESAEHARAERTEPDHGGEE